jgi:hypothetical protein
LTRNADPAFPYRQIFGPAYSVSKTALNAITLAMAIELNLSSASDLAILHSSRLNNCLTRLTQEKRVSRYPSAEENG